MVGGASQINEFEMYHMALAKNRLCSDVVHPKFLIRLGKRRTASKRRPVSVFSADWLSSILETKPRNQWGIRRKRIREIQERRRIRTNCPTQQVGIRRLGETWNRVDDGSAWVELVKERRQGGRGRAEGGTHRSRIRENTH